MVPRLTKCWVCGEKPVLPSIAEAIFDRVLMSKFGTKQRKIQKLEGGVIKDRETKLEWHPESFKGTWEECQVYCASLGNGWRMPNDEELSSLINREKYRPATDYPGMKSDFYWSSTNYASDKGSAWFVYFHNGYVGYGNKSNTNYVRAVRGGQAG